MSFSNYTEGMILDALFGNDLFVAPGRYLALWIGNPEEDGLGGIEVSGIGYSRLYTLAAEWSLAADGIVSNLTPLAFSEALTDWGDLTHFAIFNHPTAGTMILYGPLTVSPITIITGSIPRFAPGTIVVQLD